MTAAVSVVAAGQRTSFANAAAVLAMAVGRSASSEGSAASAFSPNLLSRPVLTGYMNGIALFDDRQAAGQPDGRARRWGISHSSVAVGGNPSASRPSADARRGLRGTRDVVHDRLAFSALSGSVDRDDPGWRMRGVVRSGKQWDPHRWRGPACSAGANLDRHRHSVAAVNGSRCSARCLLGQHRDRASIRRAAAKAGR